MVRVHMQGTALQRLGGCFLRHHALQARLQFALQRKDLGVPHLVVIARFVQGLLHKGVAQAFVARLLVLVPEALHVGKRYEAFGLIQVEPVACRVLAVLVLQGVFGQQAVTVPQEVGDLEGGLFLFRRFLPFGYAPTKGIVGIAPVRLLTLALVLVFRVDGNELVLRIPGVVLYLVLAAAFVGAVAPGVVLVAVLLPDLEPVARHAIPLRRVGAGDERVVPRLEQVEVGV